MLLLDRLVRSEKRRFGRVDARHVRRPGRVFAVAVLFAVASTAIVQSAHIPRKVLSFIIVVFNVPSNFSFLR